MDQRVSEISNGGFHFLRPATDVVLEDVGQVPLLAGTTSLERYTYGYLSHLVSASVESFKTCSFESLLYVLACFNTSCFPSSVSDLDTESQCRAKGVS